MVHEFDMEWGVFNKNITGLTVAQLKEILQSHRVQVNPGANKHRLQGLVERLYGGLLVEAGAWPTEYLSPSFDASDYTNSGLRMVLTMHNIKYPPGVLRAELIRRFCNNIDQMRADQGYEMPAPSQKDLDAEAAFASRFENISIGPRQPRTRISKPVVVERPAKVLHSGFNVNSARQSSPDVDARDAFRMNTPPSRQTNQAPRYPNIKAEKVFFGMPSVHQPKTSAWSRPTVEDTDDEYYTQPSSKFDEPNIAPTTPTAPNRKSTYNDYGYTRNAANHPGESSRSKQARSNPLWNGQNATSNGMAQDARHGVGGRAESQDRDLTPDQATSLADYIEERATSAVQAASAGYGEAALDSIADLYQYIQRRR